MQPLLAAGAARGKASPATAADTADGNNSSPAATVPGDACILFISSVAGGPLAGRSGSLYAISKAGLNQLAASLACEWAKEGIRVNSVAPWVTLTELGQQVMAEHSSRAVSRDVYGAAVVHVSIWCWHSSA